MIFNNITVWYILMNSTYKVNNKMNRIYNNYNKFKNNMNNLMNMKINNSKNFKVIVK